MLSAGVRAAFPMILVLLVACSNPAFSGRVRSNTGTPQDLDAPLQETACGLGTSCPGAEQSVQRAQLESGSAVVTRPYAARGGVAPLSRPVSALRGVGRACSSAAECSEAEACLFSALSCESQGVCGARTMCEGARTAHCACDGATFFAAAGCVEAPYQSLGSCEVLGASEVLTATDDDSSICQSSDQCGRGKKCHGIEGCTTNWTCERVRDCPRDSAQFCGCDGQSFSASSLCPGRPYRHRGSCE